jgi:hypothetical protein
VDRLDYTNDSINTSPKGPLTSGKSYLTATGNASFGYFAGGEPILSTVDRIDYANDTATASPTGQLNVGRHEMAATGNTSFGYFAGGMNPSPSQRSTVDRIDYSNDTATATTKGPLTRTARSFTGISPREFANSTIVPQSSLGNRFIDNAAPSSTPIGPAHGYFAAGVNPAAGSTPAERLLQTMVDRIDFTNDTATAVVKGGFSVLRANHASMGNTSNAWHAGGGYNTPQTSTTERTDYSNDTAQAVGKGNLTSEKFMMGFAGNMNYGWMVGGPRGTYTWVDRIDYSNDTATASARSAVTGGRYGAAGAGNLNYGWFAGSNMGPYSFVDRIDYANDSSTPVRKGPLSSAAGYKTAAGNSNYGYFVGGKPSNTSVERIDYANDTATATQVTTLSPHKERQGATATPAYGYFAGGTPNSPSPVTTVINRIDFSNDTAALAPKGPLSAGRYSLSGVSSRENGLPFQIVQSPYLDPAPPGGGAGAWHILMHSNASKGSSGEGGGTSKWGTTGNTGWQSISASSTGADGRTAFGDGSGLYNGFFTTTNITQMALVDGTGNMTDMTSHTNYLVYELVGSGTGSETIYEILHRLDQYNLNNPSWAGSAGAGQFVTDSCTNFVAAEGTSGNLTATSDTWLARGPSAPAPSSPSPSTTTQPHAFCIWGVNRDSDDDTQVLCAYSGDLTQGCGKSDSWRGNSPYQTFWSYWGNDWHSNSQTQTISRGKQTDPGIASGAPYNSQYDVYLMAFSGSGGGGGTPTANIPVPVKLPYAGPVPNGPAYGYVGGGRPPTSPGNTDIDRIDYSNDTTTASPKGDMNAPNYNYAAFASTIHGYFAGGGLAGSKVTRLDFANDTATPIARGGLYHDRTDGVRGAGNDLFGYVMGAYIPGTLVTRIQYYNDTTTSSPKGNLAFNQNDHGATGNQNYAWNSQGTPACISRVQRVDYANDTATAVEKGNSGIAVERNGGVGNADYGYFGGGSTSPWSNRSEVYRVDYSNDTATSSRKGDLSQARYVSLASFGSNSYGYFAGGSSPSNSTRVDRIDYSNDTATMAIKGPLTSGRYMAGGFSGQENGLPQ